MKSNPTSLTWLKRPSIILPAYLSSFILNQTHFLNSVHWPCQSLQYVTFSCISEPFCVDCFIPYKFPLSPLPPPSLPDCPYPPFSSYYCRFLWEAFLMPQLRLTPLFGIFITPCAYSHQSLSLHVVVASVSPNCIGVSQVFFLAMPCGKWDLPQSGIEPVPPALGAWNLNHWTSREVPNVPSIKLQYETFSI